MLSQSSEFGIIPAIIITFIVLLISILIFFFYKKFITKANTFLIVGLNDAGKTLIFSKLINSGIFYKYKKLLKERIMFFRKQMDFLYFNE